MDAPGWEDPRRVLARHGLAPKRGFSQNFLVSRSVIEQIVAALAPRSGELVVELGPGLGTLTAALLRAGARVIAIDADRDMLSVLRQELGHLPGLDARRGDASALDLRALAGQHPVALAGNLPYAITGSIFRCLVAQHTALERAVLMVQREVRDRLLGEPGSKQYGALSVFTRAVFEVRPVCLVPAGAFHPAPRVESAVIRLTPRAQPVDAADPVFQRCVRAAFDARRKTLRNALLQAYPNEHVDAGLLRVGIDGKRRGETLSVEEFARLAAALAERGEPEVG
jgi:16S rRNA (adenine1518-N6/adenine1519-N6)-dimethyltransferase